MTQEFLLTVRDWCLDCPVKPGNDKFLLSTPDRREDYLVKRLPKTCVSLILWLMVTVHSLR